jgi:hypothetical protein
MTDTYYNTTELSGDELKEKHFKAECQSDKILKYFRKINKPMTPSDIHMNLFDGHTPITSVRRAMSNLTNQLGLLEKTKGQKIGMYGSKEYFWELKH